MNEQPGDLLDEAVKLFETLRRRLGETAAGPRGEAGRAGAGGTEERAGERAGEDVWSRAVSEEAREPREPREPRAPREPPRIATGAPECRDCPVCRAIAVGRASGGDVREHLRQAGRSLLAAAMDVAAAFERTRPAPGPPPRNGPGGDRPAATG
ncbi:hypothetical protein [Actinomadura rugatobispora]|uniref:Uncharacterized protein n=1 Tax=Actinomadura rugatobispora TaxID=1994 RepID=A0ABW1AIZ6_9ACTN